MRREERSYNCVTHSACLNGKIVRTYADKFKDGSYHCQNTHTWAKGNKYVGEWQDNKAWQGTQYDEDGNVTDTYSEGAKKSLD